MRLSASLTLSVISCPTLLLNRVQVGPGARQRLGSRTRERQTQRGPSTPLQLNLLYWLVGKLSPGARLKGKLRPGSEASAQDSTGGAASGLKATVSGLYWNLRIRIHRRATSPSPGSRDLRDAFSDPKGILSVREGVVIITLPLSPTLSETALPGNKDKKAGLGRVRRRGKARKIDAERN